LQSSDDYILIGELTSPFGVRGEMKLWPLLARPELLPSLPPLRVELPEGSARMLKVASMRRHQNVVLVTFDGLDRDGVEGLRGGQVFLRRADFPKLPADEYYEWQLLGLDVVTDTDKPLGKVVKVHFNPAANDVYETEVALIPAVSEFVVGIDLGAGRITVRDVPGLRTDE
jgi:16S rRNA processing protein RimM